MRGSPLLRALLSFLVILFAGYPLWRLTDTGPAAAIALPAETTVAEARSLSIELTFTRPPTAVTIQHLGQEVWKATSPEETTEAQLTLPYPGQGIELVFSVAWPQGEMAALRASLRDPDGQTHERSVWGEGETTEVLSFP